MKIGSLEELKKIKEEYQKNVNRKQGGQTPEEQIKILVGMGTCGISSGSRETYNAFSDEITAQNITNAKVVPVGCIGCCHSEPTVQINKSDEQPVLYGNVTKDKVREIIEQHIKNGKAVENLSLEMKFDRV